ncbi:MAG: adenylosuccinate lyase [Bdellovibrionota bacterium]
MIERYTRPQMGAIWTLENRFRKMLDVEIAVAETQAELGIIPREAAVKIRQKGDFSVDRINEIEKTTRHDVIAFVSNVAEHVGPMGRYVHFALTSSDVIDTAMSLLVRDAGDLVLMDKLEKILQKRAREFSDVLCAGRTHGMHAEPTSFGMKLASFWAETRRNRDRLVRALEQMKCAKLSGAVGTYSTQTHEVELGVAARLGLVPEVVSTQVVPRDRHAEVLWALAMVGSGLERLSVELRHLQRTEVGEVVEGFSKGQKGSSAMPHKKNPISAENVSGCARLLRSYSQAGMENVALWHERDISHSAVERVVFPDAFILADYATDRIVRLIEGLEIKKDRMRENMNLSQGQLFSSHLLLALVEKGLSREDAYAHVQRLSHKMKPGAHLRDEALRDKEVGLLLSEDDVDEIFEGVRHREAIHGAMERAGVLQGKSSAAGRSPGKSKSKPLARSESRAMRGATKRKGH